MSESHFHENFRQRLLNLSRRFDDIDVIKCINNSILDPGSLFRIRDLNLKIGHAVNQCKQKKREEHLKIFNCTSAVRKLLSTVKSLFNATKRDDRVDIEFFDGVSSDTKKCGSYFRWQFTPYLSMELKWSSGMQSPSKPLSGRTMHFDAKILGSGPQPNVGHFYHIIHVGVVWESGPTTKTLETSQKRPITPSPRC